jgi:hypothetical protein
MLHNSFIIKMLRNTTAHVNLGILSCFEKSQYLCGNIIFVYPKQRGPAFIGTSPGLILGINDNPVVNDSHQVCFAVARNIRHF